MITRLSFLLPALLFLVSSMSCSQPKYIRGTKVLATKQNKEIIQVVEKYRRAMIAKDVPAIIAMAHPDYYQDRNSPDYPPYDYKGLKARLHTQFKLVKSVRLDIQYRKVVWHDNGTVDVEMYLDSSFQINVAGQEEWKKKDDYAKIVLKKHEDRYLILSGI